MRKINTFILTTASALTLFYSSFSQSLSFTYNSKPVKPDSAINVDVPISSNKIVPVIVNNISSNGIYVKVKKIELKFVDGSMNSFCWGPTCFSPDTYVSPNSIFITAGGSNKSFYGDYAPQDMPGTTSVMYVFFDDAKPADSSYLTVNYTAKADGIDDINADNNVSAFSVFPNPVKCNQSSVISFQLKQNVVVGLKLVDLKGRGVKNLLSAQMSVGEHKLFLNTENISKGIYYCILYSDDRLASVRKVVIQ